MSANADKRCAFCRQGSSKNADKFCRRIFSRPFPPKCRQTSSKMQTRALHFRGNCRQIMQTRFVYPESGDVCILVCLEIFAFCLEMSKLPAGLTFMIYSSHFASLRLTSSSAPLLPRVLCRGLRGLLVCRCLHSLSLIRVAGPGLQCRGGIAVCSPHIAKDSQGGLRC